tara:strand:+ start:59 stop:403 length:345 start_codon:yes stop_codon:yes gene_type:complete
MTSNNYKELIVENKKGGTMLFKMYSIDRLIKDNKLVDTKAFQDWVDEGIEGAGVKDTENPVEELKVWWDNMGMCCSFEEECMKQRVNGMLREKKLVYNPILGLGGYYIPDEVVV